jgi:hypothetical protein
MLGSGLARVIMNEHTKHTHHFDNIYASSSRRPPLNQMDDGGKSFFNYGCLLLEMG